MVYYCLPTIIILRKQGLQKSNNYSMLYKSLFESLIDLWLALHITTFKNKGMHKMMQFQTFCTRKPCFPLCN
jgi:hypothetical protein